MVDDRSYRLLRFVTSPSHGSALVGALLLADEHPIHVPNKVLQAVGDRLYEQTSAGEPEQPSTESVLSQRG